MAVGKNIEKRGQRVARQATMEVARRVDPDNFLSGGQIMCGDTYLYKFTKFEYKNKLYSNL
jgi:hypothetical protein